MSQIKHSKSMAYLRQLCCSGLGKDIVIPEFLRAVRSVIPSGNNVFSGCDEQLNPTYHLLGFPLTGLVEESLEAVASNLTPERRKLNLDWFRRHSTMPGFIAVDEFFYLSEVYNLVNRPYGQHHAIHAPVRRDGKPVGMLSLFRPQQQKPFGNCEQALCTQLLPYLAHALSPPDDKAIQYSANGSSGLMVWDTQGTLLFLSPEAKNLMALACRPFFSLDAGDQGIELWEKLKQLCGNLEAIFRGQHAAPPSWCHTGTNGRFLFRAYWLDSQNKEPGGFIGVSIEHLEPLMLRLLRALQNLPLSPTQKAVAALLAQGFASEKIAERQHIKLDTVKDHISVIFTKLDIDHRKDLLPLLLALDKPYAVPLVL
jgi:DNA-binding CsgD family transcriptional regulator